MVLFLAPNKCLLIFYRLDYIHQINRTYMLYLHTLLSTHIVLYKIFYHALHYTLRKTFSELARN